MLCQIVHFFLIPHSIEVGGANPNPRRFHLASSIFPAKTTRGTYLLYSRDGKKADSWSQNLEIQNYLIDLQMPRKSHLKANDSSKTSK